MTPLRKRQGEMTIKTDKTRAQLALEGIVADMRHLTGAICQPTGEVLLGRYIKRLEGVIRVLDESPSALAHGEDANE